MFGLLVDLMTFDIGWPLRSNQGNWFVNGLYLLNVSCYDKSLNPTQSHSKSYMVFQLTSWPLTTFKGQIEYNGLCLLNGACYDQSLHITQIVSHIYGISVDLMILDLGWPLALDDPWHKRPNQGIWVFSRLYLLNRAWYHMNLCK